MSVFVAAADESYGGDQVAGPFVSGGLVAPKDAWMSFEEAWRERVLDGPPAIPYLHMTDIRSRKWREQHGLTDSAAEGRVDEAFRVINSTGRLHPITSQLEQRDFRAAFSELTQQSATVTGPTEPDYHCFLMFAHWALGWVGREYPEATRVDLLYEERDQLKGRMLRQFHSEMKGILEANGLSTEARLLGDLIPGDKARVELQAADVVCWHERRRVAGTLSRTDGRRYFVISRLHGRRQIWSPQEIKEFGEKGHREGVPAT